MSEIFTGNREQILLYILGQNDPDKKWDIKEHKEKRSLSQNAYYWQLLEKLAVKTHTPKAEIHNLNLRHLGLVEMIDDKRITILIPDTDEAEKKTLLSSTYHLSPTRQTKVGTDGITYRFYVMLRGSADMNVAEMSALVDLAVQDAKAQGIETLTPTQLEQMRELERQHERRMENHS